MMTKSKKIILIIKVLPLLGIAFETKKTYLNKSELFIKNAGI